jgi:hypothetical protein
MMNHTHTRTHRRHLRVALEGATGLFMVIGAAFPSRAQPQSASGSLRFELSVPAAVRAEPITGRMFVIVTRKDTPEPRLQVGGWNDPAPLFGMDVGALKPGTPVVIDAATLGYPVTSLRDLPAGDYYVQALLNVYTEFHRSDGHVIWAHMDQWEGQHFNRSPGNLVSAVQRVHLDPAAGYTVKLSLGQVLPPVQVPADTKWVRHIKIESKLLTAFWGHPMYVGATALLPKDYDSHPDLHYPVVYVQGHFYLDAPTPDERTRFATEDDTALDRRDQERFGSLGIGTGYQFYQSWSADSYPRAILITFQHPTPYFDDSYAVNSANNGPYGDAIMNELIPAVEEHFRIIRKPWARMLTGGATGGWESLALMAHHPTFFGGTWTMYPDPIDFRHYDLVNIYDDDNAFYEPGHEWIGPERYFQRRPTDQPEVTVKHVSQLEAVLGSHGRSAQQFDVWQAVYGPVGDDGYPTPIWDKATGKIDHSVALYMRDHGFDLRYYIETNWPKIGPDLVGKLHFICGDMDDYYLNLAVYDLEDFLENRSSPAYEGSFSWGRPEKGHGWQGMSKADLIEMIVEHTATIAPPGEDTAAWHYK